MADGLCRLLGDEAARVVLVDPDRVEAHNLRRQLYYPGDEGEFKAEVLAARLARNYGRVIEFATQPWSEDVLAAQGFRAVGSEVILGCVDNPAARKAIADSGPAGPGRYSRWWIDLGNGQHSGQVFIGNARDEGVMAKALLASTGEARAIPGPVWQEPALLNPAPAEEPRPLDCAERVMIGDQSPVINQQMAALGLQAVQMLLTGGLDWMAAYVDLEHGGLRYVPITLENVMRVTGMGQRALVDKAETARRCPNCGGSHQ